MSRTSTYESKPRNPVKHYITFSGETGAYNYWDGTKVVQLEDLDFVVIDIVSSISGWSEAHESKIWSNYFRSTKDNISIRCGNKDLMAGNYNQDKEKIKAAGGKFQTNIFALAEIDNEWVPVVIQLTGSGLSSWSSFVEENKMFRVYQSLIRTKAGDQQKKGRVMFFKPEFSLEPLTEELKDSADNFDKEFLKPFLDGAINNEEK